MWKTIHSWIKYYNPSHWHAYPTGTDLRFHAIGQYNWTVPCPHANCPIARTFSGFNRAYISQNRSLETLCIRVRRLVQLCGLRTMVRAWAHVRALTLSTNHVHDTIAHLATRALVLVTEPLATRHIDADVPKSVTCRRELSRIRIN